MYNYELTERGKIVIAIVLVLLLLLVPSAILLYTAIANQPPQNHENQNSEESKNPGKQNPETSDTPGNQSPEASENPEDQGSEASESPSDSIVMTPPPVITQSPPPSGDGLTPVEVEPTDDGNGEENDEPYTPPESGPTYSNPSEGLLSFLFSPDKQNALDNETLSMLGDFIKSPKNTSDSAIAVEMPQLSAENAEKLVSAVVNAFTALGVQEQRLAYILHPLEIPQGAFEVHLSFVTQKVK